MVQFLENMMRPSPRPLQLHHLGFGVPSFFFGELDLLLFLHADEELVEKSFLYVRWRWPMKGKTSVKVLANLIFNKIRILDIFRSFWKLQWERRSAMSFLTPVFHSFTSHSGASKCGCFGCGLTHRLSRDFA